MDSMATRLSCAARRLKRTIPGLCLRVPPVVPAAHSAVLNPQVTLDGAKEPVRHPDRNFSQLARCEYAIRRRRDTFESPVRPVHIGTLVAVCHPLIMGPKATKILMRFESPTLARSRSRRGCSVTYYVKLLGSTDMPMPNHVWDGRQDLRDEVRFPARPAPIEITPGDELVYYAVGGFKRIFATARVESAPELS